MADVTQAEVESIFVQHVTELWSNFGNLTESTAFRAGYYRYRYR